jgi:NAD(P)-dependent dehydrogenase (short-subunit alcohol dehydrogenase family)
MASARDGRVVLIGSRVAEGKAGRSQYAATKAALIALARSWAAEVIAAGVTVNVVSPAATETAMLDDPARESESPGASAARPADSAGRDRGARGVPAVTAAGAITGQNIQICGGASLPH